MQVWWRSVSDYQIVYVTDDILLVAVIELHAFLTFDFDLFSCKASYLQFKNGNIKMFSIAYANHYYSCVGIVKVHVLAKLKVSAI